MAFPQSVLDFKAELNLGGTWTDITTYVYQRNGAVTVSRGKPDESTVTNASQANLELNNRDGRFSPRNPLGTYYGNLGRNTPVRLSVPSQTAYLRSEADHASYVSTPDSAALSITGDTEIQIDLKLSDYEATTLASKWLATGNQRSWILVLQSDGTLRFYWSADGSSTGSATSTVPLPMGRLALKVTLAVATGTVTFYTAPTISGSYTQLGSAVVVGARNVFDSTAPLWIGYQADDFPANHSANAVVGSVYGFKLLSGIGGTTKAFADFTAQTAGVSSFVDAQSNTWTLNGTAEISSRRYRFHGEVASYPQRWDVTGNDVWTPTQANGLLRRLGQGSAPLDSVLTRYWTTLTGSLAPIAYWPAEDGNGSTQIASGLTSGGSAMQITGTPNLASDSGFACSGAIPVINGSTWKGAVPKYTTSGTDLIVRFLMHIPTGGDTNTGRIVRLYTTGSVNEFSCYYGTGGTLGIAGFDSSGATLFDTGAVAFGANGEFLEVSMELRKSGSNIAYSLTTLVPGATAGLSTSGTLTSATVGKASQLWVNPNGSTGMAGTAVGQITIQTTWDSLFNYGSQIQAHTGETAGNRFARLCSEEGVSYRIYGSPSNTRAMGAQGQKKLTDLLQECEAVDAGMIYEPRESLSLGYRTRESMENQSAAVTLSYTAADLGEDSSTTIEPTDDDQFTRNDVTVQRSNGTVTGSSSRQVLSSGDLSTQAPPNGVGDYSESVSINLYVDSQVDDQAGWRLHLGTTDEPRYPSIPVNLARSALSGNSTKYYGLQDLDQGDYLAITSPPVWLPPGNIKQLVAGTKEKMGGYVFAIDFNGIPESPYEIGAVGSGATSDARVDTDGSTLNAGCTSVATSISVATTAQTAQSVSLWTTTAGDFPFDIMVGGERMTVTNITGSSSPQTFTVTRSVNGVVKAHISGEAVNVYDYAIVAMDDPY